MKKLAFISSLFIAINANAALYDRGNGMIYDSDLNITWLQDADYAKTSGYTSSFLSLSQAQSWTANLNYDGITGWRLASANPNGNESFSFDGSTDWGYNNTRSEIGHLFFELGNKASYNVNGTQQPVSTIGLKNTSFVDATTQKSDSFINFTNDWYWEAEAYSSGSREPICFSSIIGVQDACSNMDAPISWAVHDGDVAAVPVPAAVWLFGSGLAGLLGTVRRRELI